MAEVTFEAEFALLALLADALREALAVSDALFVAPLLADELSVEAADLWALACCALFAAEVSVVALLLLALFEELALFAVDPLRLALACCAALREAVELLVAELLLVRSFLLDRALLVDSFNVEFRVDGPWLEAERMEKVHRGPGGWSPLPPEGEL